MREFSRHSLDVRRLQMICSRGSLAVSEHTAIRVANMNEGFYEVYQNGLLTLGRLFLSLKAGQVGIHDSVLERHLIKQNHFIQGNE
jgi:hypothetical protein